MNWIRFLLVASSFFLISATQAGIPLWSMIPIGSSKIIVSSTGTAAVKYTVTNNSLRARQLVLQPQAGVSQTNLCSLGSSGSSCTLTLTITGNAVPAGGISGGPVLCQANADGTLNSNQCYQPSKENSLSVTVTQAAPILTSSVSTIALSVNNTGINAALTGTPRQITITNSGDAPATNLSVSYPTWSAGTTATSTCSNGGILAAGDSCEITVTPGATATSNCTTGIEPTPGIITVSANGAAAVQPKVVVLGYGCQYQGGFLFSVDDTTPITGSIGGKVAATVDQAAPKISTGPQATSIIWSSNGGVGTNPSNPSFDLIVGTGNASISPGSPSPSYSDLVAFFPMFYTNPNPFTPSSFSVCNGAFDGQCNTGNIVTFYNQFITNYGLPTPTLPFTASPGPTALTNYAAGLCKASINDYSDWYLPAVCEMDSVSGSVTCPSGMQSIQSNLFFLLGDPGASTPSASCAPPSGADCLAGSYWSSTGYSNPTSWIYSWYESFDSGGSSQNSTLRSVRYGVRCVRGLTY